MVFAIVVRKIMRTGWRDAGLDGPHPKRNPGRGPLAAVPPGVHGTIPWSEVEAIVIMGQSKSVDAILRDSLGPYTAVNIPEIPRVRRLFWEGIDCPVIQTPNALFVAVMDMTQELIAYLKGFFIQELTYRFKGPFNY